MINKEVGFVDTINSSNDMFGTRDECNGEFKC